MHAGRTISVLFGAILVSVLVLIPPFAHDEGDVVAAQTCRPTRSDAEGPFYIPGAPIRTSTGSGLVIRGRLLGAPGCRPLTTQLYLRGGETEVGFDIVLVPESQGSREKR